MSNETTPPESVSEFIRALIGAWDCCGTCAGGVLLRRDRERMAAAWDEGHRTPKRRGPDDCRCAAYNEDECGCGEYGSNIITPNPYRTDAMA